MVKRISIMTIAALMALVVLLPVSVGAKLPVSKKSGEWSY